MASLGQPHWEALTPATSQAFRRVEELSFIDDYYLAGGTGLALFLGHRYSVDLDYFSPESTAVGLEHRNMFRALFDDPSLSIVYDSDGSFVASWHEVGISFFRLTLYPLVQGTILVENTRLATLPEIGAMKLAEIIGRGTRKDLVDLYYILQSVDLEELFKVASRKYIAMHSFPVSAVRALAYFTDAEKLPMPMMLDKTSWTTMKKFLEAQAIKAGRMNLADLWEQEEAPPARGNVGVPIKEGRVLWTFQWAFSPE